MATTIQLLPSATALPAAPPSYFVPNPAQLPNGESIPAGLTDWKLEFDQTNVPAGASYTVFIEVQRLAVWTDATGAVHPAGEWLQTAGGTMSGGQLPNGTFINHIGGPVNNNPANPYPDNVRARVDSMNANWVWPRITLILS